MLEDEQDKEKVTTWKDIQKIFEKKNLMKKDTSPKKFTTTG